MNIKGQELRNKSRRKHGICNGKKVSVYDGIGLRAAELDTSEKSGVGSLDATSFAIFRHII